MRSWLTIGLLGLCVFSAPALAQDEPSTDGPPSEPEADPLGNTPPRLSNTVYYDINFVNRPLSDITKYMMKITGQTLLLDDPKMLNDEITILAYKKVTGKQAYEAFLQALEAKGYTTLTVGNITRIIDSGSAAKSPILVQDGGRIDSSWQFVTQIITLENVSVDDVASIVSELSGEKHKLITYRPTNTMILTDSGVNIRKVVKIIRDLDVAAPKSTLKFIPLRYATAAEVQAVIEELYGTAESNPQAQPANNARNNRRNRRNRNNNTAAAATATGVTAAGKESKYISKVLSDERTNSLIVLANEEGHDAVDDLISKLDVDADPLSSRSQIHVVYLEHAKAEDVAQVLSNLSQGGGNSSSSRTSTARTSRTTTTARGATAGAAAAAGDAPSGGVVAAFDSGMRITHDENTNSLVIIASNEDFKVVKQVIDQLDMRRRQVFVDAVILEISSDDSMDLGLGYHAPLNLGGNVDLGFTGFNASSSTLSGGLSTLLSGAAIGVFGEGVEVSDPTVGTLTVPAFGIVLNAAKNMGSVQIVSNPNLLTLDNEEAKIVVGRKIPFPSQTTFSNIGQPISSFQREDVAITLMITPRVNSENFVTLETVVEVSEVEEGSSVNSTSITSGGGFVTSKREIETVALVENNQTVVLGGLVSSTESENESKIPILGDLPVIGALFRTSSKTTRQSDLMVFLTPHIIDDYEDMVQVMKVKEAQRQEFIRRFYGKSQVEQLQEIHNLLQYSMNVMDRESVYCQDEFQGEYLGCIQSVKIETESLDRPIDPEMRDAIEAGREEGANEPLPTDESAVETGGN